MLLTHSLMLALFSIHPLYAQARLSDPSSESNREPTKLTLTVEPSMAERWVMTVTNTGDVPLRIAADGRLLWLEVIGTPTPHEEASTGKRSLQQHKKRHDYPKGRLPLCTMPNDMRPIDHDPARDLILGPHQRYVESIDPIALCGANQPAAELTAGAIVYPHFGWPPPKDILSFKRKHSKQPAPKPGPPFVAEPLVLVSGRGPMPLRDTIGASPVREIEGTPFVIVGNTTSMPAVEPVPSSGEAAITTAPSDDFAPLLTMESIPREDAHSEQDIATTVTVKNVGKRPALLHIRTDNLAFSVETPDDHRVECGGGHAPRGAIPDFFSSLGVGKSERLTVLLHEICPQGTFAQPGVYVATPRLVLRESGEQYQLHAFTAEVPAANSTRIRVRTGKRPYHSTPPQALSPNKGGESLEQPLAPESF